MTFDIELQRTRQQFKRVTGNNEIKGLLGDGNGTVNVPGKPGQVYVRLRLAENFSAAFEASTNGAVAIENNRPVTVTQKASGDYVVNGIDIGGFVTQGRNPLEAHARDPQIDYFTNQSRITTLLCYTASTTAAPSMEVIVREGLIVRNGAATFFSGERVDLTTHVPGTASEHLFAVLLLDTSDSIEVQVSTSQSTGTPLDMTDISEAIANASAGAIPVWAWKLENGQTSVPSSNDNVDLRQFVNPHGATFDSITIGDGSGDADLVIDGAAASLRTVTWQTNGSNRWMAGANSDLESGSDAGSNFNILNFDDSGSAIGNAVTITRSSGDFRIHNDLQVDNGAVFNEFGGDNDFRIEGDTDANLFFVDASTDRIGIGTNAPSRKFDVRESVSSASGTEIALITVNDHTGATTGVVQGISGFAVANPGSGNTAAQTRGLTGTARLSSDGTLTNAYGLTGVAQNTGVGTLSNAYGLAAFAPANTGGGTITNAAAILLQKPIVAANNYYIDFNTADNTDPTGGGGAATGRIPVLVGGTLRYLAYY